MMRVLRLAIYMLAGAFVFTLMVIVFAVYSPLVPQASQIVGELLDDNRRLKLVASDPVAGGQPTWEQVWDMPSMFRLWPDDYLNPPAYNDGVVYVANNYDEDLYAIEVASGDKLWVADIDMYLDGSPMQVDEHFVYAFHDDQITVYDRHTGDQAWGYRGNIRSPATLSGDLIFVPGSRWVASIASSVDQITALRANDGEVVWTQDLPEPSDVAVQEIVVQNGVVYVGSGTSIVALKASTGKHLWTFHLDGFTSVFNLRASEGSLVVTDGTALVMAIDLTIVTERWRFSAASDRLSELAISVSTVHFNTFSATGDDEAIALDLATGEILWKAPDQYIGALAVEDGVAFGFIEGWRYLVAFDPRTKDELWRIEIEDPYGSRVGLTISENQLFLTVHDDLFRINVP